MNGPAARAADWLLAAAASRLRPAHGAWADAMLAEAAVCTSGRERLAWAWGCWAASLRATISPATLIYPAALAAGLALMAAFEWAADEGRATILLLAGIALGLGALRPRHAWLSGALVGLVVAGVIGFEAVSGIRPAYETRAQTMASSLYWAILLIPALPAAALGGLIGRKLRAAPTQR